MSAPLQGDPNVPAGQLTLDVDLTRPLRLPDLESQQSMEELSRLVLGVHEQVQREAQEPPLQGAEGGADSEEREGPASGVEATTASSSSEPQPFVLPLGIMARNEVYPRTCKMW